MSDDITIGEVSRRLGDVQSSIHRIERRLEEGVRRSELDSLERRVGGIEATLTWLWRTVGGIVIAALLGLVISGRGGL